MSLRLTALTPTRVSHANLAIHDFEFLNTVGMLRKQNYCHSKPEYFSFRMVFLFRSQKFKIKAVKVSMQ